MNSVLMIGRLTKDPNLNFTESTGTAVTSFSIAVDRAVKREGSPSVDFFRVIFYGKTAEAIANNVKKGNMVAVRGRLENRTYKNKDNVNMIITEIKGSQIKFLEKKTNCGLMDEETEEYPQEFK